VSDEFVGLGVQFLKKNIYLRHPLAESHLIFVQDLTDIKYGTFKIYCKKYSG
jgi:hypothetical protein